VGKREDGEDGLLSREISHAINKIEIQGAEDDMQSHIHRVLLVVSVHS